MMKYLFGIACISFPFITFALLVFYDIEFSWYLSDRKKIFDLIHSIFNFSIFIIGLSLLIKGRKASIFIVCSFFFILYQVLSWSFEFNRYIAKLSVNGGNYLLLVPYDGGAFTSSKFVNLELFEKHSFLFKVRKIKSFKNVKSGTLSLADNGSINIELQTYTGENITTNIK